MVEEYVPASIIKERMEQIDVLIHQLKAERSIYEGLLAGAVEVVVETDDPVDTGPDTNESEIEEPESLQEDEAGPEADTPEDAQENEPDEPPEEPETDAGEEVWEMRGLPDDGDQGWVSNLGNTVVLPVGERPGSTIYDADEDEAVEDEPVETPEHIPEPAPADHLSLGFRIRERREVLGLSQSELGEKVKLSGAMISAIELGRSRLADDRVDDFAEALFVPKKWITNGR